MRLAISDLELTPEELANQIEHIDFEDAALVEDVGPGSTGPKLHVWGVVRCLNMTVSLDPVVYVDRPDYWIIYVNGKLDGEFCLEAVKPFHELLAPVPFGTEGILVVGDSMAVQIDRPAK